jgi:hypothetical protein
MTFVTHDGPFVFNTAADRIPPNGGTRAFWIDGTPSPPYDDCTITVTAHGLAGLVSGPQFIEVLKTEMQAGPGPSQRILNFVVRNNGPRECPYIKVYVGVIRP